MIWIFGILEVIQLLFLVYFIVRKKYFSFTFFTIFDGFILWSFIDAYVKYVSIDPCDGIDDGCMNESGMIFVGILFFMIIMLICSLIFIIGDRMKSRPNFNDIKNL